MTAQKKRTQINVRLDELELEKVKYSADILGLSLGQYVKHVVTKSPLVEPKFTPDYQKKAIRQLVGIANNLNQLTRLSHINGTDSTQQALNQLRKEVDLLWQQLAK